MQDYPSKYNGPEIDDLLDEVNGPDTTPTNGSQRLVTSGGVKAALDEKADQSDVNELSVKSTNHENRINTIEGKIPSSATSQNKLATHSEVVAIQEGLGDVYTKEQIDAKEAAQDDNINLLLNRVVLIAESDWDDLVARGVVDPTKIYMVYDDSEWEG